jgi:hypothetical protein
MTAENFYVSKIKLSGQVSLRRHNLSARIQVNKTKNTKSSVSPYRAVFVITSNLLKTTRKLFYLKTHFVPRGRHFISVIKTNEFVLYRARVAVCCEISTKHIYSAWTECTILEY